MPTFIVVEEGETRNVSVDKPAITLGRSSQCDIPVKDIRVSRTHCTFLVKDGGLTVRDEGSQNGTFVNGALVDRKALKPGDRIDVGSARIYIERMPVGAPEDGSHYIERLAAGDSRPRAQPLSRAAGG